MAPDALMRFANLQCGVRTIALTDHDTVDGVATARAEALRLGMRFVSGIEISSFWAKKNIHIVGLGVDETHEELLAEANRLSLQRDRRAVQIGDKLAGLGYPGMYEAALAKALNKDNISRLHFAQALLDIGAVPNIQVAFDRFLSDGCPAFVDAGWAHMTDTIDLIHRVGGIAVLAHPGRYKYPELWQLEELVRAFKEAGGEAIEVYSGSQSAAYTRHCMQWATIYDFHVSVGSDFHSTQGVRPLPGQQGQIPEGMKSVLDLL